jgi:MOSC domain-containing protein YiiM
MVGSIVIEGIFLSPSASQPMVSVDHGNLIQGVGLEGDRYAQKIGTYSVFKSSIHTPGEQEPGRQLTLISGDGAKEALRSCGIDWNKSMGDLRRNLVLTGISSRELLEAIGSIVEVGDSGIRLFVHRNCVPCMYNERRNSTPGLMEALWEAGGVSCEVIEGGTVSIGDTVSIKPNDGSFLVDGGFRDEGFYVRPSKRSAAMVREALKTSKELHKKFSASDPEGAARAQSSYESVGLSFWPRTSTT